MSVFFDDAVPEQGRNVIGEKVPVISSHRTEERVLKMDKNYDALSVEAEELLKDQDKLEKMLQKLEKKLKTVPVVGTSLSYVPLMISLVRAYIKGEYKEIPVASVIAIIAALIYVMSPIDIIPDVIPGIGYLDDGIVVAGCLALVKTDILDYKAWREKNGFVYEDLIDYEDVEKEASSKSKMIDAFFQGKRARETNDMTAVE